MSSSPDDEIPVNWDKMRELHEVICQPDFNGVVTDYRNRLHAASEFANGDDALYLLGLSLNGLDLVPPDTLMEMRVYWVRAPVSVNGLWENGSYIVEV